MAEICPVCDTEIAYNDKAIFRGIPHHPKCIKKWEEKQEQERQKIEEKSVYIKGGVNVESFNMPFRGMVILMVKWALASIPAFIILAIIGAIFFAIFTAIFGSIFF